MTTALTILCVSFIAMAVVVWNKNTQMSTGRTNFRISTPERDAHLEQWYNRIMFQITHVSYGSLKKTLHDMLVAVENFFLRIFVRLGKRFHTIGDIVRGKNIPRNKGAVSFFLKNIEESKKSV
ncbi:MAG: hypothetical protein V4664_03360 [Patescibacteria group bacterium]